MAGLVGADAESAATRQRHLIRKSGFSWHLDQGG
jgi:hypothetical protein